MEPSISLVASAQISVAIAGFAGVVAMFRSESVHNWGAVEKFWLRLLLLNSILPLAFSLSGLFSLAIAPVSTATWRWCSGAATLALMPYAAMIIKNLVSFTPEQLKAAGGGKLISYVLFTLLIAVCLLQLWNATMLGSFWPFFGAIVILLLGAMYQFVRLVLAPQQPEAVSEEED
jgi:hypothetical protein